MLQEIEPCAFERALPLISHEPPGFMMAITILKRIRLGRVFVDDVKKPNCALALSSSGWHAALGSFETKDLPQIAELVFGAEGLVDNDFYSIRVSRLAWVGQEMELRAPSAGKLLEREMRVLKASRENLPPLVSDHRIQELDEEGYLQASKFIPMLPVYWPEPSKLLGKGMAKALIEEGRVRGVCYSCCQAGDLHEPHITIDEPFRGQGIGKLITQAYTRSLLEENRRIFWSHYIDNEISGKCAKTAGYLSYGSVKVLQYIEKK